MESNADKCTRRWIRLLFGREFPFQDLLALWDTLLAEDPGLDLIDMVCVAMMLRIRWQCEHLLETMNFPTDILYSGGSKLLCCAHAFTQIPGS